MMLGLLSMAQGSRLSVQCKGPTALSICGINDSAFIEVYNISSGTVTGITVRLNLPSGIKYVRNSLNGAGVSEYNVTNLNQPEFSAADLNIAKNFKFRILLSADCDLLAFLNGSNTPLIQARAAYTGNFDLGSSIPFQVRVPSAQYGTITNLTYTGDIGSKFGRTINIGNYGKGPLRELKLIRINGRDLKTFFVNKGNTTFKGDTVITIFNSAFFKTIGNMDTLLDQNETISLTDSNLIQGCKSLNTAMELSWGCNSKNCQTSKTSGSVQISNRTPTLKALPFPVTPTCFNKYNYVSEIRFVNTGNMPAIDPQVSISLNYPYVMSSFDTSSVRIKIGKNGVWTRVKKDSTTNTYNQGYYGCIGLYPIGFFRIKSSNLKPNDTLYLMWRTESCTAPPCSNASMLMNSWAYAAEYKDQCLNVKKIPWTWGKVYDQHYLNSSSFIPTDLINNQTGEFRMLISSASLLPRSSSASYIVDLILPKGLKHSKLKKDLYFINAELNANWNPDSLVQKGDTLRGYFPHPVPISLTNAELVYYLKADCSAAGANGVQTIKLQIRYNPDKNCNPREWLYLSCQSMQLKIHCYSNCNGGMKFRNFSVQRINFGAPDNNNDGLPDGSGVLDTLKVREERCFMGDTIEAVFTGTVKRTSTIISWRNAYIETNINNGKNLDIAGVQLLVWRRGITLSLNCNQLKSWKTVTGNNANFKIDLSTDSMQSCVSSGFRYNSDDSLIVKVKFRVSTNIGGNSLNIIFNNRFYTSNVNNPSSNANKFQCDTFSGQMIMTGYYFTTCCNETYQVNSCSQIAVNNYFYMGIGPCCSNYGGNNYFPYEYRNFGRIKSVRYYLPQGYKMSYSRFLQVRTAGSNKTVTEYKDSIKANNINSYPIVYDVSSNYKDSAKGTINFSDDAFHGYYMAVMQPSCEIQTLGNIPIKYDFIFERRNTLGSGFDTISSGNTDQIVYNKPVTSIKPSSPTIYAAKDTAEWEVVYTNYSSSFSNINTWFAPDNSGAVKVVQIRDAQADTALPSVNSVFRAGTIPYNQTRKFKIRAIYNTCMRDSVILYTGWNCVSYPKDLNSYPCLKERIALYIEPQNTQYQSTLTDSVNVSDLCATTPYTLTIENTGATTGYNTRAYINLPIGMSVVSGSCYIRYPHTGAKTALPLPVLKNGTVYEWNLSALNSTIASGFKGVSDISRNKIIIYFSVKTDCDYSSGNYIRAGGLGNIKCGDPVLSYPSISRPLNIKGVSRPYYTLLKTEADTIFPCEKPARIRVKIINLGPAKTGLEDKYQALLLPGMIYDSSLFKSIYNSPDNKLTRSRNINGATEVEFSLMDSIVPGDSMSFEFGFQTVSRELNCGNTDIYSQAAVKQDVVCVADNSKCMINVVTGNNLLNTPVIKSNLNFTGLNSSISNISPDSEFISLEYIVNNKGSRISYSKPIILKYVYDLNASGTADPGDPVIAMDTQYLNLENNESRSIAKNIRIKAGISCALFVALDSASCSCGFASARFPVPVLKNAGSDAALCSGDTVNLGTFKVNAYRYQWMPGSELNSDTIANPYAIVFNQDTANVSRQFILSTYRGMCSSRDTVNIQIYRLPEIAMLQKDTIFCEGNSVRLKVVSSKGSGLHKINWTPSNSLNDAFIFSPLATPLSNTVYKALISDIYNCKAVDSVKLFVKPVPAARFVFDETCSGNSLLLRDSSTVKNDSIIFYRWTGNGLDTMHVKQVMYDFKGGLKSSMKLEVRTGFCTDTFRSDIYLNPLPVSKFSIQNVCFGDTVKAIDSTMVISGTIADRIWFTGDGNTQNAAELKYLYTSADTFAAGLISITDKLCRDSFYTNVIVYPRPNASFTVDDVCHEDSSEFKDISQITGDSISGYLWISDTDSFSTQKAKKLFQSDGTYNIRLFVESLSGCRDSIEGNATVHPNPVAAFRVAPVCEGDSSFCNSVSTISSGSITSWKYTLSDASIYNSKKFSHKFAKGDTFGIELIVASQMGCKDTAYDSTIIYPELKPDFSFSNKCLSDSVNISDMTSFVNTGIRSWKYLFTPSDSIKVQNPVYKYTAAGNYMIKQTVVSNEGCVYERLKKIGIYPLPKVKFADSNKCIDNRFSFNPDIQVDTGTIVKTEWDFGDNSVSGLLNPLHDFPSAGQYRVRLKAETDLGCIDSFERIIESFPPVTVSFTAGNVCLYDPVQFMDRSVTPKSFIKSYLWEFGDGDTSTFKNPSHFYFQADTYSVKLSIISGYNCIYDTIKKVIVYPVPQAGFITDPDNGTIVDPEINITDQSADADTVYYDLGDGNFSSLRNLVNAYPDSGVFLIRQFASNIYGCRDTFSKEIKIHYLFVFNAPTAFSPNNDGNNDVYAPGGIGIREYSMQIFNRWGELIYFTDDSKPWDGTYQGTDVMEGVYAVTFRVRDFKGRWHFVSTSLVLLR